MRVTRKALLVLLIPALAAAQSLGDAAQKEKERRKKIQHSGTASPVITDDELKSNHGTLANDPKAAPAASPQASPKPGAAAPTPASVDPRRDEESWRSRVAEAQVRIDDAKKRYDMLNGLSLVGGEYYVDENGKPLITSLEQLRKLIAQAKAQMDAAQNALDGLLESARQQNVPPGWLR